MEKTIIIDDKKVTFKSTGALPKRYKMQFQRDFFSDLMAMEGIVGKKKPSVHDIREIDFEVFYDIAWCLAKAANPSIPDPLTWLDSFSEFPIIEILPELQDMLAMSISSKKK